MRRTRKYRWMVRLELPHNLFARWLLRRGIAPRAYALLETVGRRTGRPRQTPVGDGLAGDTFWLVAVHGMQADYVRNILANPRVRVKAGGRWRTGTAHVLTEDDATARSKTLPHQWDKAIGRAMATQPVTIRIDLDTADQRA